MGVLPCFSKDVPEIFEDFAPALRPLSPVLQAMYETTIYVQNATLHDPKIARLRANLTVEADMSWETTIIRAVSAQHTVEEAAMAVPTPQWVCVHARVCVCACVCCCDCVYVSAWLWTRVCLCSWSWFCGWVGVVVRKHAHARVCVELVFRECAFKLERTHACARGQIRLQAVLCAYELNLHARTFQECTSLCILASLAGLWLHEFSVQHVGAALLALKRALLVALGWHCLPSRAPARSCPEPLVLVLGSLRRVAAKS